MVDDHVTALGKFFYRLTQNILKSTNNQPLHYFSSKYRLVNGRTTQWIVAIHEYHQGSITKIADTSKVTFFYVPISDFFV